jgi:hypothetical protein
MTLINKVRMDPQVNLSAEPTEAVEYRIDSSTKGNRFLTEPNETHEKRRGTLAPVG